MSFPIIVLDARAQGACLTVVPGQIIDIALNMAASAGYLWEHEGESLDVVRYEGLQTTADSTNTAPQRVGHIYYRVVAAQPGQEEVALVHRRPFSRQDVLERFQFTLRVQDAFSTSWL